MPAHPVSSRPSVGSAAPLNRGDSPSNFERTGLFVVWTLLLSFGAWLTAREGKAVWPQIAKLGSSTLEMESVRKIASLATPLLPGMGLMGVGAVAVDKSSKESRLKKVGRVALLVWGISMTALGLYAGIEFGKVFLPEMVNIWKEIHAPLWQFKLPFRTGPCPCHGCPPPSPLEQKILTVMAAPFLAGLYVALELACDIPFVTFAPLPLFIGAFGVGPGLLAVHASLPKKD